MEKFEIIQHIFRNIKYTSPKDHGTAWAPSNVALCKYWGKRNLPLNLPVTSSLSISLGKKGANTNIKIEGLSDKIIVDNQTIEVNTKFYQQLAH